MGSPFAQIYGLALDEFPLLRSQLTRAYAYNADETRVLAVNEYAFQPDENYMFVSLQLSEKQTYVFCCERELYNGSLRTIYITAVEKLRVSRALEREMLKFIYSCLLQSNYQQPFVWTDDLYYSSKKLTVGQQTISPTFYVNCLQ